MATKKATTAVATRTANAGAVASIKDAIAAQVAALGDRIAPPGGNQIKLAPNMMTLPDGTKTPGPLELVFVDFVAMNEYYPDGYDKDNIVPPVCFAIGSNPLKLVPSPNSPELQAKSCAECPMNLFKSDARGKGKACKNGRSIAVLPPTADATTPLWKLKVSPTALRSFDSYVADVARSFNTIPAGVITTVGLNEAVDYPSLTFSDPTPNPQIADHFARQEEARAMLSVEPDVSKYGVEQAAKPAVKAPAKRPAVRR